MRKRKHRQNNQLPGCLIWIALAIFFLPLVLIPMWIFKRDWSIKKKAIISVVLLLSWGLFIGFVYSGKEQTADPVAVQDVAAPITTQATTAEPTAALPQTPVYTQESMQEPTADSEIRQSWVWIPTDGGKKYHTNPVCSGMEDPISVTIEDAKARGFDVCGKCY